MQKILGLVTVALCGLLLPLLVGCKGRLSTASQQSQLRLNWDNDILSIQGAHLPGGEVKVWYMEAYCRPGSTTREWGETVIGHRTELVSLSRDRKLLKLRCALKDGVVVDHRIQALQDEVDFRVVASNPTDTTSLAHWAQPCIRVGEFTGRTQSTYLGKSFIFVAGELVRMPTRQWASQARYVPGQVWCPGHVSRDDINPRPLSPLVPSNGLIGCYSSDEAMIMATAWEPYQELFQGVIVCLHSDFRIGGLEPGESKSIRGKIYLVGSGLDALLERYRNDFPEHE